MQSAILFFSLLLILFILGLAYWVFQSKKISIHRDIENTSTFTSTHPSKGRNINRQKWQKLLKLVHGDVDTANRLIDYEQKRNPDRSLDWCIDKALWQLQRDRH